MHHDGAAHSSGFIALRGLEDGTSAEAVLLQRTCSNLISYLHVTTYRSDPISNSYYMHGHAAWPCELAALMVEPFTCHIPLSSGISCDRKLNGRYTFVLHMNSHEIYTARTIPTAIGQYVRHTSVACIARVYCTSKSVSVSVSQQRITQY